MRPELLDGELLHSVLEARVVVGDRQLQNATGPPRPWWTDPGWSGSVEGGPSARRPPRRGPEG
jgi:hypothetical protein